MTLTPAIFFITIKEFHKRFLDDSEIENMRAGQICAVICSSMSSKRKKFKWTDFFKKTTQTKVKKKQSIDEMESNLEKITQMLGGDIVG